MPLIFDRVQQARIAVNPKVICKMKSGWAVIGDVQFLPGFMIGKMHQGFLLGNMGNYC